MYTYSYQVWKRPTQFPNSAYCSSYSYEIHIKLLMNKLPYMQMDDLITFSISKPKMKYRLSPVFLWYKILLFSFFFYIQTLIEIINSFRKFRKPLYSLNSHSTANKRKLEKETKKKETAKMCFWITFCCIKLQRFIHYMSSSEDLIKFLIFIFQH